MEQRITMITLGVDDLAATRRFFEEGLGWKPAGFDSSEVCFYDMGSTALGLFGRQALADDACVTAGEAGFPAVSLAWNGRTRDDVDAAFARAVAAGAEPLKQPQEVFWGGYSGYVRIPGGHLLEIAYNPVFLLDENSVMQLPVPKDS